MGAAAVNSQLPVREPISTRFSVKYNFTVEAHGSQNMTALRGFKSLNTFAVESEENDLNDLNGWNILNHF